MWLRVFGTNEIEPDPKSIADILQSSDASNVASFQRDEHGWFVATLRAPEGATLLQANRYLASEEGIRSELNAWAAWLETQEEQGRAGGVSPLSELMLQVISTKQLFTIDATRVFGGDLIQLCQFLARETAGVYQVDGMGFFDQNGACLLAESSEPSLGK
jgi:hypothetical protein